MNSFNAFISEILTIDYSYFWDTMEVVAPDEETSDINLIQFRNEERTFIAFSESTTREIYVNKFRSRVSQEYPDEPSINLIEYAITDLLMLTNDQQQAQIKRLEKIMRFWHYNFEIGASEESILYESLCIPDVTTNGPSRGQLNTFLHITQGHGIMSKNLPDRINNIFLCKGFYDRYVWYTTHKAVSIGRLIAAILPEKDINLPDLFFSKRKC
ncbi:hypothetical protein [Spirosoma sp.]|uniref:hypothetical protein n=1 Tax=Spirosoma sp. TaxID=1899569 RepID=UPI003B3BDAB2